MGNGMHEDLSRADQVKIGSNRAFGFVFAAVFAILGLVGPGPYAALDITFFATAGCFGLAGWLKPALLAPLNRVWFRFGLVLHRLTNPLIMGLIFFFVMTPMAIVMRLARRDLLNLKIDKNASSYWIRRDPPGPDPKTMNLQF